MKRITSFNCFCLVLYGSLILGCSDSPEQTATTPEPAGKETATVKQPVLAQPSVDEPKIRGAAIELTFPERDFGEIWDFESVTTTFPFTNVGTKVLVLNRMQAGCGCTVPVADKMVLQPGESGTITVTFDPKGKSKKQDKKVTIFSNAVNKPELEFWIRSTVKQFVEIKKRFLELNEMKMGETHSLEFEFFPVDPNFEILKMVGTGLHGRFISAEEVDVPAGSPRRIRINVASDKPWGAFHSQLVVTGRGVTPTGTSVNHTFTIFANGKTFGQLRADKHIISLGSLRIGGSYHKRIHIFREDGAPFKVLNATVLQPTLAGINVTAVQSLDGSYELIISGTLPSTHRGPISEYVMVQTDVKGEEVLRFRIAASVPKK